MNRNKLLIGVLLLLGIAIQGNAVIQRTLIDFNMYDQKVKEQFKDPEESYITNIDGAPKLVIGYKDYLLENWKVELNESASQLQNRVLSYCKPVVSQRFGNTLGVRVHFPKWNNNSYALVKPPFPIKIYNNDGQYANAENGVLPNISEIKSLSVWVNGKNYRYGLAVRLKDRMDNIHEFFMGWLMFDGWRKLVFMNPNYTDRITAKSLQREPLYPYDIPYMVLDSIVIYRPSDQIGGDFVTYFKNIEVEYNPYIVDSSISEDIKDEEVWNIITTKTKKKMELEEKRLSENLYLYQQEKFRMDDARKNDKTTGSTNK